MWCPNCGYPTKCFKDPICRRCLLNVGRYNGYFVSAEILGLKFHPENWTVRKFCRILFWAIVPSLFALLLCLILTMWVHVVVGILFFVLVTVPTSLVFTIWPMTAYFLKDEIREPPDPRRRTLKNIAYAIANRFLSRNNDINGYWALGICYAAAEAQGTDTVQLDLLDETTTPEFPESDRVVQQFSDYLFMRTYLNVLYGHVTVAKIDVQFNLPPTPLDYRHQNTWGEPFVCSVTIIDDLNVKRTATLRGWCGKHDPVRERRRKSALNSERHRILDRLSHRATPRCMKTRLKIRESELAPERLALINSAADDAAACLNVDNRIDSPLSVIATVNDAILNLVESATFWYGESHSDSPFSVVNEGEVVDHELVNLVFDKTTPFPGDEYPDFYLGALWGSQIVRQFDWHWSEVTLDRDDQEVAIIAPDKTMIVFPFAFVSAFIYRELPCNVTVAFKKLLEEYPSKKKRRGRYENILLTFQQATSPHVI